MMGTYMPCASSEVPVETVLAALASAPLVLASEVAPRQMLSGFEN